MKVILIHVPIKNSTSLAANTLILEQFFGHKGHLQALTIVLCMYMNTSMYYTVRRLQRLNFLHQPAYEIEGVINFEQIRKIKVNMIPLLLHESPREHIPRRPHIRSPGIRRAHVRTNMSKTQQDLSILKSYMNTISLSIRT